MTTTATPLDEKSLGLMNKLSAGALDTLKELTDMAADGAWKLLVALGAFVWLVGIFMQVEVRGETWATLSTGEFATIMICGSFALALGTSLRVWSLHQVVRAELAVSEVQKALTVGQQAQTREAVDQQSQLAKDVATVLANA